MNPIKQTQPTTFDDLGLSPALLRAVADQGYSLPSPIQLEAIPAVLAGQDVMGAAQTGTGKTAGFTLPILQRLAQSAPAKDPYAEPARFKPNTRAVRVLIVTPTRELAAQVAGSVETYGKYLDLTSAVVFGGVGAQPQIIALRKGVDILVATPGRLLDLVSQKAVQFASLEVLVLDEADRMLDMGFIHDIRRLVAMLPKKRQTLLFSATFSQDIRALAGEFLIAPVRIDISPETAAAETVAQLVHPVDKALKPRLLSHLITLHGWEQVLVFTRTKHGADRLTRKLVQDGIDATAIHGNKSQGARTRALADFKSGRVRVLVATDIAGRGLDIRELPQVVNFELPDVPEDYVHRIGRTGRAGLAGRAVSLVSEDEAKQLLEIERLLKQKLKREVVAGFAPSARASGEGGGALPQRQKTQGRPVAKAQGRLPQDGARPPSQQRSRRAQQRAPQPSRAAKEHSKQAGGEQRGARGRKPAPK